LCGKQIYAVALTGYSVRGRFEP